MSWITPKTDWVYTDYFNVADYNRIKDNLLYLCDQIGYVTTLESITSDYIPTTTFFHNINNLTKILYNLICHTTTELRTTFYENSTGWTADELNIIEGLIIEMYTVLKYAKKLPLVLGGVKF